jgi:hypothetical protein
VAKLRAVGPKKKTLMVLITEDDVKRCFKVFRDTLENGSAKDKLDVAMYLIDQRFGRPRQALEHTGADGGDIKHEVSVTIFHAP